MSTTKESSSSPPPQQQRSPPPPAFVLLIIYLFLGFLISYFFGREPGTLPKNIPREIAPAVIVVCAFLLSYNLWDCMAVGITKGESGVWKSYKDIPSKLPEAAFLAQRVQTNQVEQMNLFIIGTIGCAILVNGTVAAILSFIWFVIRRQYASVYRNAIGVPFRDINLGKYTIPAYFVSGMLVSSVAVHSLRAMMTSSE